jgi:hypothetical protein
MDKYGNMDIWFAPDGTLYAHGMISPLHKEALYNIKTLAFASVYNLSMCLVGTGDRATTGPGCVYLFYTATGPTLTNVRLRIFEDTDQFDGSISGGDTVLFPVKFLPFMSTVSQINIMVARGTGSGATIVGRIKAYINQSSTLLFSKTVTRDEIARGYVSLEVNKPYVNSIQLSVEIETSVALGGNDFATAFATINYEPTSTAG